MAGITTSSNPQSTQTQYDASKNYTAPLIVVTMLFFMWGFITCMNDILIPKLQQVFTLQNWEAMLVQTAFFGAYFVISLIYYFISVSKGDPIARLGYKNAIILALSVAAIGCALFYPAASFKSFGFFLTALFVLASGITVLQIAANPYVTILGPPETGSSRLSMAGAFNSLGTTIAPAIGGWLIFEGVEAVEGGTEAAAGAESVQIPYLGLAGMLLLLAFVFKVFQLPKVTEDGIPSGSGALKYRHLILGIVCIFMYVGGEVTVGSILINFLKMPEIAGFSEATASKYLSLYWGGAMIGRFFGAVSLGQKEKNNNRYLIMLAITAITCGVIWHFFGLNTALIVLGLIVLNVVMLFVGRFVPNKTLGVFAATVVGLLLVTIFAQGEIAMWSAISIGLFNSVMWPVIFALAIADLGKYTSQGSSLLVMAIVGGAIVPPLQGYLADITNIQLSFFVPIVCYLYIMYYGFAGYKPQKVA